MAAESLQAACELAYAVARDDAESDYLAEPPPSMRSFLYVSDLPRRAITVAQQAIEDDSEFRTRVAARATEDAIGRAGYLWLHRPPGWASEFEELTNEAEEAAAADQPVPEPDPELEEVYQELTGSAGDGAPVVAVPDLLPIEDQEPLADGEDFSFDPGDGFSPESPPIADAPMATVSPIAGNEDPLLIPPPPTPDSIQLGTAAVTDRAEYEAIETNFTTIGDADGDVLESGEGDFEADALESELSSLRGLVDRLAGERDVVVSNSPGPSPIEAIDSEISGRVLESELMALESDLEAAKHELSLAQADLASARHEREEAQRLHSETLKRQVDLEKELAAIREERMDIETQASDAQVSVISLEDKLGRTTTQLEEAERERNVIRSQLETMTSERNHIREDRSMLKSERDDLAAKVAEIEEQSGGADIGELVSSNRTLTVELDTTSRELARMIAQAESFEEQIQTTTTTADALKTEKIELTSRLADTELALETTRTQHDALKTDSERLAAEVGTLRAERDGLQVQLTELQASLADVLNEQAEIRQRNDADRKALNELRVERDVLMARMADLEQADRDYDVKLKALVRERDDLVTNRDDLIGERGQLRAEMASFAAEKEQSIEDLNNVKAQIGPLEIELQAERRQREELANRLLELDDIAEQNASDLVRLTEERNELSIAVEELLAERTTVNEIRIERDNLNITLQDVERRLEEEEARSRQQLAEMSDQLTSGEQSMSQVEQRLTSVLGELDTLRAEYDEVNREVRRLTVVEEEQRTALAEATAAAEAARADAIAADAARAQVASEVANAEAMADAARIEAQAARAEADVARADAAAVESAAAAATEAAAAQAEAAQAAAAKAAEVTESAMALAGTSIDQSKTDDVVDQPSETEPAAADTEADPDKTGPVVIGAGTPPAIGESLPDLTAVEPVGDISQEVPVVEFPPSSDAPDTVVADGVVGSSFAWPPPPPSDQQTDSTLAGLEPRPTPDVSGVTNTGDVVPGVESDEDDLDEVSELIAQTVSGFSDDPIAPSVLPDLGTGDDNTADVPVASAVDADAWALDSPPSVVDDLSTGEPTQAMSQVAPVPPSVFGVGDGDDVVPDPATGGPRQPGSRRRQIEIPADILDDEVAVAQFVVASPDVVLLVDGDSVAKLGWPSLVVAEQRDALVTYLADLSASSGAAPDVVFDGRIGDDDSLPASRAVRIRLSTPPTEPAAALDELVDAYPDQWPIALVTDDKDLADSASERGAAVLNNGQLLDLFIAQ